MSKIALVLFGVCLGMVGKLSALPASGVASHAFAPGGAIHIDVPVGDVTVRGTGGDQIRVSYRFHSNDSDDRDDAKFASDKKLRFEVQGSTATVRFESFPKGGSVDVDVLVPAAASLDVHLGVGDLTVDAVEGSKDLEVRVGDVEVGLGPGSPKQYGRVDASARIGDVKAPWPVSRGMMGQHLQVTLAGRYHLHAHAGIGDVKLE